jgi:outer membrane protein OmpA-like peptidoglycan-associated protein
MTSTLTRMLPLALACLLAAPSVAVAQDAGAMEADEIGSRLDQQVMTGKTRGLRLGVSQSETGAEQQETGASLDYATYDPETTVFSSIVFDLDSAAIRADQRPKIDRMCEGMRAAETAEEFVVIGHTDALGEASYNERLSRLRAEEVKRYMVDNCGFASEQIEAVGVGEQAPLPGSDPNAPQNRRVELQARASS